MFLSIISPVYNVNKYLPKFFESFLSFNKEDFEIIIVNDKSPEDPLRIINKYEKMINIKTINNKKNLGLGFSRNVGLENISDKTTHYMFVDSDDEVSQKLFENIEEVNKNKIIIFKNLLIKDKDNEILSNTNNNFLKGCGVNTSTGHLFPKDIKIDFFSRTFEDIVAMAQITAGNNFEIIEKKYNVIYKMRAESITHKKWNNHETRFRTLVDLYNEILRAEKLDLIRDKKKEYIFIREKIYFKISAMPREYRKISPIKNPKISWKVCGWFLRLLKVEKIIYKRNLKKSL